MALIPKPPEPLKEIPRRITAMPAPLTMTPLVPETRMEPKVPLQSMVIDLVIVTAPNPPGSRQSISPAEAVFEIAPAKVLHGATRLHGLASSPTPDTQVRSACAKAEPGKTAVSPSSAIASNAIRLIVPSHAGVMEDRMDLPPGSSGRFNPRTPFAPLRNTDAVCGPTSSR